MSLFVKLAKIADQLDAVGNYEAADKIDELIKEAKNLQNQIIQDRFWSKVKKSPGCWKWNGALDSSGYGALTIGGKNYNAHRLSYEWATGKPIPKGQVLLHSCDDRTCLNPKHLTPGTQVENIADRVKKNRSARGAGNGRARLTERDIKKIKKLRSKGWTETAIARIMDCSRSTISHILRGDTWSWLND